MTPVWLAVTGWILLSGCETLSVQGPTGVQADAKRDFIEGPTEPRDSMKRRVHLVVPFFPDNADQCGPATLASILTYWGIPSDPQTLKEEVYLRRLRGSLSVDLLLAAQARGLQAEGAGGTLDRVKTELAADRPVVALLNLGWTVYPKGHYVIVTGYDEQRQGVYLHSGMARNLFVPYAVFLNNWEKTGRWMLQLRPAKKQNSAHE
jgi:predicted double-glycine peptidase